MAADLLDKAPAETKLKQAIGNIHLARDVGEHLLVVGRDGVLLAGPKSAIMEVAVVMYGKCCARSIFLKSIFSRCFIVVDILNQTRILIQVWCF